eukprot:comp21861_c1_seq1/m.49463 comp21861_c1_seq1/g.49463  ORF comp21861_c1_seq1/g.49463 comp21861_c1_seq1/m.49463 type:complete len:559 (+) comp21861_c1_seq1:267-1943(+)
MERTQLAGPVITVVTQGLLLFLTSFQLLLLRAITVIVVAHHIEHNIVVVVVRNRKRRRGPRGRAVAVVVQPALPPLIHMQRKRRLLKAPQQRKTKHKRLHGQIVLLPAHHERARHKILARRRSLGDLRVVHPVRSHRDVPIPRRRAAGGKLASLRQCHGRHLFSRWILDQCCRGSMHVCMHKQIALLHVPLDKQLVLLRVLARHHNVVLRGDKPVELFKPQLLAHLGHRVLDIHLLQRARGLLLLLLDRRLRGLCGLGVLLRQLLHLRIVVARIRKRTQRQINVDLEHRLVDLVLVKLVRWRAAQQQHNLVAVQLERVDDPGNRIAIVLLRLDNPPQILPVKPIRKRRKHNLDRHVHLAHVRLNRLGFGTQLVLRQSQLVQMLLLALHHILQLLHNLRLLRLLALLNLLQLNPRVVLIKRISKILVLLGRLAAVLAQQKRRHILKNLRQCRRHRCRGYRCRIAVAVAAAVGGRCWRLHTAQNHPAGPRVIHRILENPLRIPNPLHKLVEPGTVPDNALCGLQPSMQNAMVNQIWTVAQVPHQRLLERNHTLATLLLLL